MAATTVRSLGSRVRTTTGVSTREEFSTLHLPGGITVERIAPFRRGRGVLGYALISDKTSGVKQAVPIDNTGFIPEDVAVARLLDIRRGNRKQHSDRSPLIDLGLLAKNVAGKRDPAQFR